MRVEDLVSDTPPEPLWQWTGYLNPGTVTLLAGVPKVGKSWLVWGLLAALTRGEPFLGLPTRKTSAVYLSEEPKDSLAEKARTFGVEGVVLVSRERVYEQAWPALIEKATAYALAHGHGVLIIDTFASLSGIEGDDENNSGEIARRFKPLNAAAAAGLAVLVVVHQRKSRGNHGQAVRGSNHFIGAANIIAELEFRSGRDDDYTRVLKGGTSHYRATPKVLTLELTEDGYVVKGEREAGVAGSAKAANNMLDRIEAALPAPSEADLTKYELADATELSVSTIEKYVPLLAEQSRAVSSGGGKKGDPVRWRRPAIAAT